MSSGTCPDCMGKGWIEMKCLKEGEARVCPACNGSGPAPSGLTPPPRGGLLTSGPASYYLRAEPIRTSPLASSGGVFASADGRRFYVLRSTGIERVPTGGGQPQVLVRERVVPRGAQLTDHGIYYLNPSPDLKSATLRLLPPDGGEPRSLGVISGSLYSGLSISPDETSILYSRCDQCAADIMLVENFK